MIYVTLMFMVNPGSQDVIEKEFRQIIPVVRNEPGVLAYTVHRSLDDPLRYFVYEKYENEESLMNYTMQDYFRKFSEVVASVVDGEPELHLYTEIC